ncbi:AMP-binding enzyme [Streptomyces asiaticus]
MRTRSPSASPPPRTDAKWGDVVGAVVVPAENAELTAEDVVDFARANMASYKKPRHVWFTDKLPTSPYGKVLKRELRKIYGDPTAPGSHRCATSARSGA